MYALNIDKETNRVLSATFEQYAPADAIKTPALPHGNLSDWLYYDNDFHYDPLPEEEIKAEENISLEDQIWAEMAVAIREGVNSI